MAEVPVPGRRSDALGLEPAEGLITEPGLGGGFTGRIVHALTRGEARPRRRGASERETATRQPRRRRTGTKGRLVGVFRQGLAVLVSVLIAGHALPEPSWRPEAWME
jgi:hypothetical protein